MMHFNSENSLFGVHSHREICSFFIQSVIPVFPASFYTLFLDEIVQILEKVVGEVLPEVLDRFRAP